MRKRDRLVPVRRLTPGTGLSVFHSELLLVDVIELLISDSLLSTPLSIKDVGLKRASFRNGFLCGVVDVTGGSLEETSLIVSIFVTLEGVCVNSGVVEKVALRVFLREGEFGVASGHVVGAFAEFDALFIRLQAALGVFKSHQAKSATSEDGHVFPELGSLNGEKVTTISFALVEDRSRKSSEHSVRQSKSDSKMG